MEAQRVVPILNVSDVAASVAWFAKLGWTRSFQWSASADDPHGAGPCEPAASRSGLRTSVAASAAG